MTSIPNVSGLEDWELGVLQELRLLKGENLLEPVLDAIASCLGVLYQRDQQEAERERKKKQPTPASGPLAAKLASLKPELERREIEALVAKKTIAGQMLSKSKYTSKDILWVIAQELAAKRQIVSARRCSIYISKGNAFAAIQGGLPSLGKDT